MGRGLERLLRSQFIISIVAAVLCICAAYRPAAQQAQNIIVPASQQHVPVIAKNVSAKLPAADCSKQACLALSFDDGPNPIATPIVLQALEQAHVQATFFVVGSRAVTMPYLLQRMHRDGDEIGDHSWTHPDMTTLTPAQVDQQIAQTQAAVVAAGLPAPTMFRPPYGFINATMKQQIQMPFIMWNDDSKDWATRNPADIIATVEAEAKPGGIVDMHDIYPSTGQALPQLIASLQSHYRLVTVSQLLHLTPTSRGEYFDQPTT